MLLTGAIKSGGDGVEEGVLRSQQALPVGHPDGRRGRGPPDGGRRAPGSPHVTAGHQRSPNVTTGHQTVTEQGCGSHAIWSNLGVWTADGGSGPIMIAILKRSEDKR